LLRDFADAAETYPDAHWPTQAQRTLRGLIRAWHTARDEGLPEIPASLRDPLIGEFRQAIRVGLAQLPRVPGPRHSTAQHPGRDLLEFCRDREDDVLRFCFDTRVWPTKTQQKISGRLTSEDVTQDRLDIRSYIDTARKHSADVITALHQAITGNPWKPPLATPT
jgi:transposase